jgi:hypothetical protein
MYQTDSKFFFVPAAITAAIVMAAEYWPTIVAFFATF